MRTPTVAALWLTSSQVGMGEAMQAKTQACTKLAPVSLEARWTKPVLRANALAVVVRISRMAVATCAIVSIGELLGDHHGLGITP